MQKPAFLGHSLIDFRNLSKKNYLPELSTVAWAKLRVLFSCALLSLLSSGASASTLISVNDDTCSTNFCWTATYDQNETVMWIGVALDDAYLDVAVDSDTSSAIDGWETVSLYLEYQGEEYLVSNYGVSDWTSEAPSNLDVFNEALKSGTIRLKKGPNFIGAEMSYSFKDAQVRFNFGNYQSKSVNQVNLDFNQVTLKRPIDGTGNREDGRCQEMDVAGIINLGEVEGLAVITENAVELSDPTALFSRYGKFERPEVCADSPLIEAVAPIWVLDGRGGKRYLGDVELSIVEERVASGAVIYEKQVLDQDGDGVSDDIDAFPDDPAASVDTDGDGMPDYWNPNATAEQIAASTLTLDNDTWLPTGATIYGEATDDSRASEISGDGSTIINGNFTFDGVRGRVRVFELIGGAWRPKGDPIVGSLDNDGAYSPAINHTGNIIAVGAPDADSGNGYVKAYEWKNGAWSQRGSTLVAGPRFFGFSIDLDASGNSLVVGSTNEGSEVHVYDWDGNDWASRDVIAGTSYFGYEVDISADGQTVAIGDPSGSPSVRVFRWVDGTRQGLGSEIAGNSAARGHLESISLSNDGNMLATSDTRAGTVSVYSWSGSDWVPIAPDLSGALQYGECIELSGDGSRLVVGSTRVHEADQSGSITVFESSNGEYLPIFLSESNLTGAGSDSDIYGEICGISDDGKTVFVTAPWDDSAGTDFGYIQVWSEVSTAGDSDSDGVPDDEDAFPNDPAASIDTDGDGMPDDWNEGKTQADSTSDPLLALDEDDDGDGFADTEDAFPNDPAASVDTDGDGTPDDWNEGKSAIDSTSSPQLVLDNDDDNDGVADSEDSDPLVYSPQIEGTLLDPSADTDNDGVSNEHDHFPEDPNEVIDLDFDGLGNNADDDDDGDGVADAEDAFPENPFEQKDTDGDGVGDYVDAEPNNANVQSLTIAQALVGITESVLRNCLERQTQELTYASELESLRCGGDDGGPTTDLSGIRAFYNLQIIYLGRGAPSTLEPLRGLIHLRSLGIANYDWDFNDFGQLAPFYNLDEFYFDQVTNLSSTDMEPLERLPRLTHFSSGSKGTLTSLEFLAKLPRLQRLGVNYSGVLDYSPVNYLKYLRDFYAWSNNPAISNVAFLDYAPNLRYLSLERNQLTSVNGIEQAVNLERFAASNSLIRDIGPLASLKNLKNLYLPNNIIEDVAPLKGLPLQQANLDLNKITKVFGKLPDLNSGDTISLDSNPISCGDLASYKVRQPVGAEVYFESTCVDDPSDMPVCPYTEVQEGQVIRCALGETTNSIDARDVDYQGNTFSVAAPGLLKGFELLIDPATGDQGLADVPLEVHIAAIDADGNFQEKLGFVSIESDAFGQSRVNGGMFSNYGESMVFVDTSELGVELERGQRYVLLLHSSLPSGDLAKRYSSFTSADNFLPGEKYVQWNADQFENNPASLKVSADHIPQHDLIFTVIVAGEDSDGDGVLDSADAFPFDPAASIDADSDGKPDDWNTGYSEADSTSSPQLTLDEDDDGDGVPDISDYAPKNSEVQYATLKQAYDGLENSSLQACIQSQNPSLSQVTNLFEINCQNQALYREIGSLAGLAAFPNIERIYLTQIGNLKKLDELRRLSQLREFVYLESPNTVSTLWPLSGLQFLERFEIQESVIRAEGLANLDLPSLSRLRLGSDLRDLAFLSQFPRLEALLLNGNAISDFSAIKGLSELTELSFADNAIPLTDLSILNGSKLKFVALQQMGITSLESMPASGSIEFLSLQGNQITNLDGLQGLSGLLQTLEFLDNPVSNLSPIRNLRVQNLWLGRTNITDLEPISEMTELKAIHLDGLQVASLDPLVGLPNLVELNAEGPTAFDAAEVSKLTGLKRLRFKFQQLKSLDGLADLAELQFLDVASNALTDISALRGFSNLTWLSLETNQVSYLGNAFANMKQGPVRLSFNPILCSEIDALRAASGDQLDIVFETDCVESSGDADQDGVLDQVDDFPSDPAASKDSDGDGKPDDWNEGYSASDSTSSPTLSLDEDDDSDGVPDVEDAFPLDANRSFLDADNDDVADSLDNCPNKANNSQLDTDDDGQGDACDTDDDGDGVLDPDDAFPLDPKRSVAGKQKAIIIAGGGPYRGNYLWEATENMANLALTTLRAQGIKREDIYYLTAGFGDNADEGATLESIERVLLEWAVSDEAPADDLLIYLVDHGGPGVFEVDQATELEAAQLDAWLDQIQTSISGTVSVVYDACQSGSFIPSLAASDGQSRLLIASAGADQPAIFAARGEISFSHNFWSNYLVGGNIYSAFNAGRDAMAFVLDKGQKAEIEANGDGIPNQKADRIAASSFQFGFGITLASDLPSIGRLEGEVVLSGEKTTQIRAVDVTGATRITGVSAIVTSPDQVVASADTPITQLIQIALQDENGDGTWEGEVTDLEVQGTYVVTFFATNEAGLKSIATAEKPNRIEIVQTKGRAPNVGKDTDGDGAFDLNDAFPLDPAYSDDEDGDFIPDELDQDVDGDGRSAELDGPDIFENEVDRNGAAFLGFGSGREQLRNFHTAKDVDYAWFWVTEDASYRLTASIKGDQRATGSDLALTLTNGSGASYQSVGKVDETLGGETESVEFAAEKTERVWVSLRDFNGLTGAKTAYAISMKQINSRGASDLYVKARPQARYQALGDPFVRRFEVGNAELGADAERAVLVVAAQNGWSGQQLPEGCSVFGYDLVCELGSIPSGASQVIALPLISRNEGRADLNVFVYAFDEDGRSIPEFEMADNELAVVVMTSADSDQDRLPDEYELRKGLDPSVNDAESDLDGDGITNLDEYLTGTDPASVDEDRDGDGYADISDLFPDNPEEWADADLDNTGDNEDADDDNDNVLDIDDAFPFQGAYSQDSDLDGLPNAWETANSLNPNDPRDAYQDLDIDGLLNRDEFVLGADPSASDGKAQVVYTEGDNRLSADEVTRLAVFYDTTDANPELSGLGVRVHVDTELIESLSLVNVLQQGLLSVDGQSQVDIADLDRDPATDGFWQVAWSSTSATWPGSVPIKLFDIEVLASVSGIEAGEIVFRFSVSEKAVGYEVSGASIYSPITSASLDIDGDGTAGALTDGLLVIRFMFGFTGSSLTAGAIGPSATITDAQTIANNIKAMGVALDIDGDGEVQALTDGLLIIRRLFGFEGDALTSGAIAFTATRSDPEVIASYIDGLTP
ncbi:hypothetical protein N9395_04240 [Pseudomonadales bacterium]|nr:hypothetical protein [Pseudomonadales bacterium]